MIEVREVFLSGEDDPILARIVGLFSTEWQKGGRGEDGGWKLENGCDVRGAMCRIRNNHLLELNSSGQARKNGLNPVQ